MSAEQVSLIAGVILSLIFSYVPGAKDWYDKLASDHKRLVMLAALLIVPAGVLGLSCIGRADGFTCDADGIWAALEAFILAAIANQTAYSLTPRGDEAEG